MLLNHVFHEIFCDWNHPMGATNPYRTVNIGQTLKNTSVFLLVTNIITFCEAERTTHRAAGSLAHQSYVFSPPPLGSLKISCTTLYIGKVLPIGISTLDPYKSSFRRNRRFIGI